MRHRTALVLATLLALSAAQGLAGAQPIGPPAPVAPIIGENRLPDGVVTGTGEIRLGRGLAEAEGQVRVVVELAEPSVGEVAATGAPASDQRAQAAEVGDAQGDVLAEARRLDPGLAELGRTEVVLPSLLLAIDAGAARRLVDVAGVRRVQLVHDYQKALDETVPYIGAEVGGENLLGLTGAGVTVAVLDSGIDYTHEKLGGAGDAASFQRAYGGPGTATAPPANDPAVTGDVANERRSDGGGAYFPTAKVIDGFDFVGESWTGDPADGPERFDPNPIDIEGHGTSVSDIIAGRGSEAGARNNDGVAPGASLYGIKVCASFSSSCSGIALFLGIEYAIDPDGDGVVGANAADVVNLSLGQDFGTAPDDSLSRALDILSGLGVQSVASAGNGGDQPFIAGTPASASAALSVAQTNTPSAKLAQLRVKGTNQVLNAVFQPWSRALESGEVIDAPLQYGGPAADDGAANTLGCEAFRADSLLGLVVLVDRGSCNASFKVFYIQEAGGIAAIIGLNPGQEPFEFGFGGLPEGEAGDIEIPAFTINFDDRESLKRQDAAPGGISIVIDPSTGLPLVGTIVGSSSRGPSMELHQVKPEIGAPGASVSAVAGSGTGTAPFGGTSGAAPMVSGAAALLTQAFPARSPAELKAMLMNTAETEIRVGPSGPLTPITRIGGGEIRLDRAVRTPVVAYDAEASSAALSFGFQDVTEAVRTLTRTVTVRNFSNVARTFSVRSDFRFADDAGGAVQVGAPPAVTVGAFGTTTFPVTLRIDGAALRRYRLDSGPNGANAGPLTLSEYDGYVTLVDQSDTDPSGEPSDFDGELHLPFHVLPRQAGDVQVVTPPPATGATRTAQLGNAGIGTAGVDAYTLLGTSEQLPPDVDAPRERRDDAIVDLRAGGAATFEVPGGVCLDAPSFVLAFAASTYERQTHANAPALIGVEIDTDRDGKPDYEAFTFDVNLALSSGQNATFVADLRTGDAEAFFLTDHATVTTNRVLLVCAEQIGLTRADMGRRISVEVFAQDILYSGDVTDTLGPRDLVIGRERYTAPSVDVPTASVVPLPITDNGAAGTYGQGVLLLNDATRADADGTYRTGAREGNEITVLALEPAAPGPDPVIPEVPVGALLPVAAAGLLGLAVLARRRKINGG